MGYSSCNFIPPAEKGSSAMTIEEIKTAIRALPPEDRRRLALFILELEKEHFQANVGPQITQDLEGLSKVVQETVEKIKKNLWPSS